jgi:hypothetical protein
VQQLEDVLRAQLERRGQVKTRVVLVVWGGGWEGARGVREGGWSGCTEQQDTSQLGETCGSAEFVTMVSLGCGSFEGCDCWMQGRQALYV